MVAISGITSVVVALAPWAYATTTNNTVPPQAVLVDPLTFNVLGINGSFREDAIAQFFNPTNRTPPFFQVFDPEFLNILGPNATIRSVAVNPQLAFAHEAPVWVPETDEVFFSSRAGNVPGISDIDHNNRVSKINLGEVARAIKAAGPGALPVNVSVTQIDLPEAVQMTNGGTGPFFGKIVLVNSGRGPIPPSLVLVDPVNPSNATVLLDNFFGRQFNSVDDAKIHPRTGNLFFTDVSYGFLDRFRPTPLLPNQVYRLDPVTGSVRVVADGFVRCNGIAFSPDGSIAFVTDSGLHGGFLGFNQTTPATIYAYDVDPKTSAFVNRRVFAYVDTGVADGIQLDAAGNVYAGCGDGTQVWNSEGTLLGKFFLGTVSANMIFAGDSRLVILADTAIFFANIAAKFNRVSFP
ncbi:hypothetical protein V8D89_002585 [Ganoderma adspersum]